MIHSAILALHIGAALVTVGLICYALISMVRAKSSLYRALAFTVTAVATLEVATGVFLIVTSPDLNVMKTGLHIGFYLGACAVTNAALYLRAQMPAWTS